MSKLKQDFGVRALIAVLLIVGVFSIVGMLMWQGKVSNDVVLTLVGTLVATVNSVVIFYFGVRAIGNQFQSTGPDPGSFTSLVPFNNTISPENNQITIPETRPPNTEQVS